MEKHSSNLKKGCNNSKVKLLCRHGGKIQLRPTDHQLSYVGGDTKILAVDRTVKFSEIVAKLNSIFNRNDCNEISLKYQLPGEDLDSLVSLIDDEDVEHMMVEYDRMQRISTKPARLRIFIFDTSGGIGPPVKPSVKETVLSNPDYLFGFDKEYQPSNGPPLDLLQIPGIIPPENYKTEIAEGHVTATAAAAKAVYRVPAVVTGGVCLTGAYEVAVANAMGICNPEHGMMSSAGNSREFKVNQRNFLL